MTVMRAIDVVADTNVVHRHHEPTGTMSNRPPP